MSTLRYPRVGVASVGCCPPSRGSEKEGARPRSRRPSASRHSPDGGRGRGVSASGTAGRARRPPATRGPSSEQFCSRRESPSPEVRPRRTPSDRVPQPPGWAASASHLPDVGRPKPAGPGPRPRLQIQSWARAPRPLVSTPLCPRGRGLRVSSSCHVGEVLKHQESQPSSVTGDADLRRQPHALAASWSPSAPRACPGPCTRPVRGGGVVSLWFKRQPRQPAPRPGHARPSLFTRATPDLAVLLGALGTSAVLWKLVHKPPGVSGLAFPPVHLVSGRPPARPVCHSLLSCRPCVRSFSSPMLPDPWFCSPPFQDPPPRPSPRPPAPPAPASGPRPRSEPRALVAQRGHCQCRFLPGPSSPATLVLFWRTQSCRPISNIRPPTFSLFTSHLPRLGPFHPGVPPRSLLMATSAASGLSPPFRASREPSTSFSYC